MKLAKLNTKKSFLGRYKRKKRLTQVGFTFQAGKIAGIISISNKSRFKDYERWEFSVLNLKLKKYLRLLSAFDYWVLIAI